MITEWRNTAGWVTLVCLSSSSVPANMMSVMRKPRRSGGRLRQSEGGRCTPRPASARRRRFPLAADGARQERAWSRRSRRHPSAPPTRPIYQNVDAKPYTDPAAIKANLIAQPTAPVRWTHIVKNMLADGVTEFTEPVPAPCFRARSRRSTPAWPSSRSRRLTAPGSDRLRGAVRPPFFSHRHSVLQGGMPFVFCGAPSLALNPIHSDNRRRIASN